MMQMQERIVSDEIKRLVPVLGRKTALKLSRAYLLGDENTRLRLLEMIDVVKASVLTDNNMKDALLLEPPEKTIAEDGDVQIGSVLYGNKEMHDLNFSLDKFLTHTAIFGSSGYGKTNLSYNVISELAKKNVPVIIFDFSKMNYRDLLNSELKERINVYTIGKSTAPFNFNPLIPPQGISKTQWAKEFASIFDHAYWLLGGGRHIVLKALDKLYEENKRPTLNELRSFMIDYGKAITSREKNWIATAERPMESLCMKELGDMLNCRDGKKPSEFFEPGRITIIELDALSDNDKAFFIEIILQWLRDWMLVNNSREKLLGVMVLEEAHHVLNREKTKKMGSETVMDLIFREVRELGLGIVYIDQHPSMVSYPALGNTSTHIYLNLGLDTKYSSDIADAASMLGLSSQEDGAYLRRLPIGEGFVLMRNSKFPYPFLVKFKKSPTIKGSVSESDVEKHMQSRIGKIIEEKIPQRAEIPKISAGGLRIVRALGLGKGVFASQLYRALRISGSTFRGAMDELISSGIVGMKPVKLKRTCAHYYFLSDLGEASFHENFGTPEIRANIDTTALKQGFERAGYAVKINGENMAIEKGGETDKILLVSSLDRCKVFKDIGCYSHYICASDDIACVVVQQAARFAKNTGKTKAIYVATQDLRRGFEKIEL